MTADPHQKSLSRTEKFGLVSGLIGLIADTITLGTLLMIGPQNQNNTSLTYALILLVTSLTLIYGWIILAWILTRRNLNHCTNDTERQKKFEKEWTWATATIGIGLLLAPLALIWFITLFSRPASPTQQPTEPTHLTITLPTPTEHPTQTPALTPRPTRYPMSKTADTVMGMGILIIVTYPITGVGVALCLYFLMPLVYKDLPLPTGEDETEESEAD